MFALKQQYPYVLKALLRMTGAGFDTKTVDDAAGTLQKMKSPGFIAAFAIAEKKLRFTKQLSLPLQEAMKDVADVQQALMEG